MAKNITLLGANYPGVTAVQLPQTGGGIALFYDPSELGTNITFGKTEIGMTGASNTYTFDMSSYNDGVYMLTSGNSPTCAIVSKRNSGYAVVTGGATVSGSTVSFQANSYYNKVYITKLIS